MSIQAAPPLILVIDDVLGRRHDTGYNEERANICAHFSLLDETGDGASPDQSIRQPVARAVFCRGQTPVSSSVGETVSNDLDGIIRTIKTHWETHGTERWALVLLDLSFVTGTVTPASDKRLKGAPPPNDHDADPSRYFGLAVLSELTTRFPGLPVVILSSRDRGTVSRSLASEGALGFIGTDAADGVGILSDCIFQHGLLPDPGDLIVGRSPALLSSLRSGRRAGRHNLNLLLQGERGTGKELMARYINRNSGRGPKTRPLGVVNCALLDETSFRRELFGFKKGAFPGADYDRPGSIELSTRGDIFLDEVAGLPAQIRSALLRLFDDGLVTPVGGNAADTKKVAVRFLGGTSEPLDGQTGIARLGEDFFERVRAGGVITIPPLRERKEDIPLLVKRFVRDAEAQTGARAREITPEALQICAAGDWPGNVRQLRNTVFAAVLNNADTDFLMPRHLAIDVAAAAHASAVPASLDEALRYLDQVDFGALAPDKLQARLPQIETTYGDFLVRYLRAALRLRGDCRDGAGIGSQARFMTGDDALTTTAAYDLIKRIVRLSGVDPESLPDNDRVRLAWEKSVRARTRRGEAAD